MKDIFDDTLKLRNDLKEIIDSYPESYKKYADRIGIEQRTLLSFLKGQRVPRRMSRWKIEQFVQKNRKDKGNEEK